MKKQLIVIVLAAFVVLAVASGAALANSGNPSATVPSNGDTSTGAAAGMYGSVTQGQAVFNDNCAQCHGPAGEPTDAFPGLNDVQNPNPNYSIDPELYDANPALFARNIDAFIQHGSNPDGVPAPMPAFGDNSLLTQGQIADAEAYVMSLSNVTRPVLGLNGTSLTGSNFVPNSSVQLYQNGNAIGSPVTPDGSGRLPAQTVPNAAGIVSANYASLDVYGIYPNGDSTQQQLGLDGANGAGATVASVTESSSAPTHARYYWGWYDNATPGSQDWVLIGNPQGNGAASADVYIGRNGMPMMGFSGVMPGQIPNGSVSYNRYPGMMDGPVTVDTTGAKTITSQRSLWGGSLEEVPGTAESQLSDHDYWAWYDQYTPGYTDWMVIANPADATDNVTAQVSFRDLNTNQRVSASYNVYPGQRVTPTFDGHIGGPVELKAFKQGGSWPADARSVIASQRVLSGNGSAFNEVPGTPASQLSDRYLWTWYDDRAAAGSMDWVVVSNPSASATVHYQVKIQGNVVNAGDLAPGKTATPRIPETSGGPVEVTSTGGNVIASQRTIWGPSFEETPGLAASQNGGYSAMSSNYNWTLYDERSAGSLDWMLLANTDSNASATVYYEITSGSGGAPVSGTLGGGQEKELRFPGLFAGPVTVNVWADSSKTTPVSNKVIASQRVLWNGYFNEVMGTPLS